MSVPPYFFVSITGKGEHMATRPKKAATAPAPDEAFELLQDDAFGKEQLGPALQAMYAEMNIDESGQDATVHVSKLPAASDPRGFEANVWKGDPEQYDLEQIALRFGSGQYRVKVYVRLPTGQKACKANKVFGWLLPPEDENRAKQSAAPVQVTGGGMDTAALMGLMRDMVKEAVQAIVPQAPQQPQQTRMDILNEMKMMRDIMGGGAAPAAPVNPMGMMKDIIETVASIQGDREPIAGGSTAGPYDLMLAGLNKFAPLLEKVLSAGGATNQPAVTPATALPAPAGAPQTATQADPANAATTEGQDMGLLDDAKRKAQEMAIATQMRMGLNFLCTYAQAGADPYTYAGVVLDSIPPEGVKQLLDNPQWLDYLASFAPDVKTHEAWFKQLREDVIEEMAARANPGGEDTPEPEHPAP